MRGVIGGELIQFDPQVLFQRLALAGHGHIDHAFDYELCQFPPALAESPDFLHEPQKANFADALWTSVSNEEVAILKQAKYAIKPFCIAFLVLVELHFLASLIATLNIIDLFTYQDM